MSFRKLIPAWLEISYLPLLVTACITVTVVYIVYSQTELILKERLQERLLSIVSTASLQFDANKIMELQKNNGENKHLPEIINQMRKIRDHNKNLKYIYIWSKTNDPSTVSFTADAEMLDPIDRDGNGKIEDEEIPPEPGEPYSITDTPEVIDAFNRPVVLNEFIVDKWGTFLSGFAPIKNDKDQTVAILGVDVEVSDYYTLIRATFVPFALLSISLLFVLTLQTMSLIKIWKSRVELVKELDRQKDELLSIVSHQLATPITSLKWYIEMLRDSEELRSHDKVQKELESMQTVGADLADLVSLLLDVSRFELGRMKILKEKVNIPQFLDEIIKVIDPKAKEKSVNFEVAIDPNLKEGSFDPRLTRMTIENLLSNAVKYTPENGKVSFHVTLRGDRMVGEVRDTGMGIPKADQGRIFEKLFRASNTTKIGGNGFGLYIAKNAMKSHGGDLRFESAEGKGATFFFELPIV